MSSICEYVKDAAPAMQAKYAAECASWTTFFEPARAQALGFCVFCVLSDTYLINRV
jgi:hypothetical protein